MCHEMRSRSFQRPLHLLILLCIKAAVCIREADAVEEVASIDVLENEDARLECRFPGELFQRASNIYWIRTNRKGHDNVAIGDTPFPGNYEVLYKPEEGIYDLKISNATYDQDNGLFECKMKEGGRDVDLYSKTVELTVLLKPSEPTISPESAVATEEKPLNLTCSSIGGSPPPTIIWYSDEDDRQLEANLILGRNKDEPTLSVYTFIPRKEDDGSVFRCTVWNRALGEGRKLETTTRIAVNYFPRVQVGPENPLKVEKDDTARLECHVDAKPAVSSVKWTRDNGLIKTHFNHTIPRVTLHDAGSYVCSAQNGLGRHGKAELKLDILFAPIVNLPNSTEIYADNDAAIDCQVTSNPRPTSIQWFKEGDEEFMQNGPTLRLTRVGARDNGRYICSASNFLKPTGKEETLRTGNATIEINIRHKPGKGFITPSEPTAVEGKPITLTCGANPPGFPVPEYKWWKSDGDMTLATGSEFTIESVRLSSAGTYMCQPVNELGEGTVASIDLEVHQSPSIITPLKPTIVKRAGDTGFLITCSAVGKPKPAVKWFKDGEEITGTISNMYETASTEQENVSNMAFNVLSTLKFAGLDRIGGSQLMHTDRGHYTCQFENEVGRVESTMFLRIEHSPVVVHLHNKVAFDLGDTALISCKMQAFPAPRFDWSFGNTLLQSDLKFYETNTSALENDVYESILRINRVSENSYGNYNCKGTNSIGGKRTIIRLQPRGKPERPENVRAVEVSYASILIGWDSGFDGGYSNTTYTVQYRRHDESRPHYVECGAHNACNLTSLDQHSQYHVMVKASNSQGESKYSQEATVVTKVDISQIPVPENVNFEKTTNLASFYVNNLLLPLIAEIELKTSEGSWAPYNTMALGHSSMGEIEISVPVSSLRVRYCLETNEGLCGPYAKAQVVDVRPSVSKAVISQPWLIAVIVLIALAGVVAIFLTIKCCCCSRSGKKSKEKERPTIVHGTQAYTGGSGSGGIENKGVDTLKDADEMMKNNLFAAHGYEQSNSNTNSANGGSVNSQDSLWNVKGAENNPALLLQHQQQMQLHHQQQQHMNGYGMQYQAYPGYEEQIAMQQQFQQQQQQQQTTQQNGYSEEYAHYPYPDEYLNERNQQFLANNGLDPYGRPMQRMESDYSPYGDISGLPDPYNGGGQLEEPQTPTHHQGHMSFDDAMDGQGASNGYTTPTSKNRRVIREIIV